MPAAPAARARHEETQREARFNCGHFHFILDALNKCAGQTIDEEWRMRDSSFYFIADHSSFTD
jgi:hypothetical protein